jgi:hypothetical protein
MADTQLLSIARNADIAKLLKKAPLPSEVSVKRPKAVDILQRILAFSGGQVAEWHEAESYLFTFVADWFGTWMKDKGAAAPFAPDRKQLATALQPYDLASLKVPATVYGYQIGNPKTFVGAIKEIGLKPEAETAAYVLRFASDTEVYLSAGDHYAYPIRIHGNPPQVAQYEHSYVKLLSYGLANTSTDDARALFLRGELPDDIKSVTALVATHICESDRNWLQLLTTLLELGLSGSTTFASHAKSRFPWGAAAGRTTTAGGRARMPTPPARRPTATSRSGGSSASSSRRRSRSRRRMPRSSGSP